MEGRVVAPREPCPALCPLAQHAQPEAAHPHPHKGGQHAIACGPGPGQPSTRQSVPFAGHSRRAQHSEKVAVKARAVQNSAAAPPVCPAPRNTALGGVGHWPSGPQEARGRRGPGGRDCLEEGSGERTEQDVQAGVRSRGSGVRARQPGLGCRLLQARPIGDNV